MRYINLLTYLLTYFSRDKVRWGEICVIWTILKYERRRSDTSPVDFSVAVEDAEAVARRRALPLHRPPSTAAAAAVVVVVGTLVLPAVDRTGSAAANVDDGRGAKMVPVRAASHRGRRLVGCRRRTSTTVVSVRQTSYSTLHVHYITLDKRV